MDQSNTLQLARPLAIALLLLLGLNSCRQIQREKKTSEREVNASIEVEAEATPTGNRLKFDSLVNHLSVKPFPVIDTTNYDHTTDKNLYTKEAVATLKLEHIYPDFHKTTHQFKAKPGYKIEHSKDFHSVVVTVFKGENELESLLITYDLQGNIIDYIVIAYDEIAEGWSKKVAAITKNYLRIDSIFWGEIEAVTQTTYTLSNRGKIEEVASTNLPESIENYTLINSILRDLQLQWAQIETGYLFFGELSQVTKETLVIIPEIAEEDQDLLRFNTHMVLVNARTGTITHQLFETYRENGWQSDAIAIESIEIDPLVYRVNETEKAFAMVIKYRNHSQPNPYVEEIFSLYTKEQNTLKKILDPYTIYESTGIVNVNSCYAEYTKTRNTLSLDSVKTNGYFNIRVENTSTKVLFQEDEQGDCSPTETVVSNQNKVLTYNGKLYEEASETGKTRQFLEFYPKKIENLQLPKFRVAQAYQIHDTKIVSGYYEPTKEQHQAPDTENDWGDRLLQLDQEHKILYRSKGVGDVYLYEPHFYKNDTSGKVIIIAQKWFEYPFGGEVFILENNTIKYIGTLDIEGYNPEQDDDQVLTKIVEIKEKGNRLEFSFKSDQLILNPGTDDRIIDNHHLKYIYKNNTLYFEN